MYITVSNDCYDCFKVKRQDQSCYHGGPTSRQMNMTTEGKTLFYVKEKIVLLLILIIGTCTC